MNVRPNIVIVEDERAQLLVLRTTLRQIGDIHEFTDPLRALDFMKRHAVDVAIIDVHMPNQPIDGLAFVRSLRVFDRELSVIIRTADTSPSLADQAIELRAFRRAIKGHTTVDQLRELTQAAIEETRLRRQVQTDAERANSVKSQWVQTLGSVEEAFSVTDSYQAVVHGMQNQLTALAGIAEVLSAASEFNRADILRSHITKNRNLVAALLTELTNFLAGPFAHTTRVTQPATRATANGLLAIVQKHFAALDAGRNSPPSLSLHSLGQDMYIAAKPLKLLIALRHLIEFCRARSQPYAITKVTARCIDRCLSAIESLVSPKLVLAEKSLSGAEACVVFQISSRLEATSLQDIHKAFRDYPENPHHGNLQMITLALRDELVAVTVHVDSVHTTVFQLYVAVAG